MQTTCITIPNELFATAESSAFSGTFNLSKLVVGPDEYCFDEPLFWDVTITNTGDALLVSGSVKGVGRTFCGRCLADVDVSIDGEVEEYFLLHYSVDETADQEEEDFDEFEILPDNHIIDMEPILQAACVLDLPVVPLCSADCKGLCPDCGANLNIETCGCAEARAAADLEFDKLKNPFSVLKELDLNKLDEDSCTTED